MSTLLLRTLREDPADAEVASHRLLVRAGYIRRTAPGIYAWLPLGQLVRRNIERIIRTEMDAAGAQEVQFPALLPREPYDVTGRWSEYGDLLFRLTDRHGADYLLGPTHEEMFTLLVKELCSSYQDLPLTLYQVQTKYRDEARPRAGLLRAREFVMKDAYSFDLDDAGLATSYTRQRDAYLRIFDRLGLQYVAVSAVSGAMGGSRSEEFLCPLAAGEDTFAQSPGGYAANVEAVRTPAPAPYPIEHAPPAHVEDTPDTPTIDSLVALAQHRFPRPDRPWTSADTLKNIALMLTHPDGHTEPLVIGVPGDREVELRRVAAALEPATAAIFTETDFGMFPGLVRGYIGPQALGSGSSTGIRYLVDPRVVAGTRWLTGANQPGRHVFDLVCGRDFAPDGTIEAAEVRDGDPAPDGSGPLRLRRGVELGHIFALGRRYAEALGLSVLDENGALVTPTMGSYGIGVSRVLAAVAESTLDAKGLCWPREVSPADVHLIAIGRDDTVFIAAEALAAQLDDTGVRVLYDDRRRVSAGVKLADAELIGVPTIVVVGRGLAGGTIELTDRASGERVDVPVGDVAPYLTGLGHPDRT